MLAKYSSTDGIGEYFQSFREISVLYVSHLMCHTSMAIKGHMEVLEFPQKTLSDGMICNVESRSLPLKSYQSPLAIQDTQIHVESTAKHAGNLLKLLQSGMKCHRSVIGSFHVQIGLI